MACMDYIADVDYTQKYLSNEVALHAVRLDHDVADLSAHCQSLLKRGPAARLRPPEGGQAACSAGQGLLRRRPGALPLRRCAGRPGGCAGWTWLVGCLERLPHAALAQVARAVHGGLHGVPMEAFAQTESGCTCRSADEDAFAQWHLRNAVLAKCSFAERLVHADACSTELSITSRLSRRRYLP